MSNIRERIIWGVGDLTDETVETVFSPLVVPDLMMVKHQAGKHDQQTHAGATSAGFSRTNWEGMGVPERRDAWEKLSVQKQDSLASAGTAIKRTISERLSFAGQRPNTGNLDADIEGRVKQIGDFIHPDASDRIRTGVHQLKSLLHDAGASESSIRALSMEAVDALAAQENESLGRTLGDHGVRHVLGNASMALDILNKVPGANRYRINNSLGLKNAEDPTPKNTREFVDTINYYDALERGLGRERPEWKHLAGKHDQSKHARPHVGSHHGWGRSHYISDQDSSAWIEQGSNILGVDLSNMEDYFDGKEVNIHQEWFLSPSFEDFLAKNGQEGVKSVLRSVVTVQVAADFPSSCLTAREPDGKLSGVVILDTMQNPYFIDVQTMAVAPQNLRYAVDRGARDTGASVLLALSIAHYAVSKNKPIITRADSPQLGRLYRALGMRDATEDEAGAWRLPAGLLVWPQNKMNDFIAKYE